MTGLDTNVLVRYVMQDDPRQSLLATALVEGLSSEAPGFVALVSMVELSWVLSSSYALDRAQIARAFEALLRSQAIVVDSAETVWKALRAYRGGRADFADCLIERSAAAAGCVRTMTFDRQAAKSAGMTLIE